MPKFTALPQCTVVKRQSVKFLKLKDLPKPGIYDALLYAEPLKS